MNSGSGRPPLAPQAVYPGTGGRPAGGRRNWRKPSKPTAFMLASRYLSEPQLPSSSSSGLRGGPGPGWEILPSHMNRWTD